jgi:hypothetical protein
VVGKEKGYGKFGVFKVEWPPPGAKLGFESEPAQAGADLDCTNEKEAMIGALSGAQGTIFGVGTMSM